MYDDVLLPTDGSEGARGAAEHAIELAATYDATLHTLYVVDTDVGTGTGAGIGQVLDALEAAGETAIDRLVDRATEGGVTAVEGSVAQGPPHRVILEYVDDRGVDLVVMGTHGRTGLDRYLLGSVTEKVVRLSDAPVLTVGASGSDGESDGD
jgi:nucleotide-binding universal stress UspA family protein